MTSWQDLRDMHDAIEVPLALMKFARAVMHDVIPEARISEAAKDSLYQQVRETLDKHIAGYEHALAEYIVVLMQKFPLSNPYQHLDPEECES